MGSSCPRTAKQPGQWDIPQSLALFFFLQVPEGDAPAGKRVKKKTHLAPACQLLWRSCRGWEGFGKASRISMLPLCCGQQHVCVFFLFFFSSSKGRGGGCSTVANPWYGFSVGGRYVHSLTQCKNYRICCYAQGRHFMYRKLCLCKV